MNSYILQNENALFYECGFSCDNAIFLKIDSNCAYFITDSRYTVEAKEVIKNADVVDGERNLITKTVELIKKHKLKKIIFDPRDWSVEKFSLLQKLLHVEFIEFNNFSQIERQIKTKNEINIIKEAVKEGKKAFDRFCQFIKNEGIGMSEEELHFNAELIFKNKGKFGLSFSPIVAINENAAKPHALPSKTILKEGDLLLLDAGVTFSRYCSDRTRTVEVTRDFNFSKSQIFSDKTKQKVYDTVLFAQEAAIKSVKVGVRASHIDKAAREVIDKAGFGNFFVHSTGHGVGLDIHELPLVSQNSETIIKENMIFTIEPGIYIPNKFGIRIEDMIVVTKNGAEIL